MSHKRMTRAVPPDASRWPDRSNAKARISSSPCPRSTWIVFQLAGSQTWIESAESPHASSRPSGLKASTFTWSAWLLSRMIGSPVFAFQTRAVVSQPAETSCCSRGCQASAGIRSVWPRSERSNFPLCTSHRWMMRSSPAEASLVPSGLNARALTGSSWPGSSWISTAVAASQRRILPSSWPVASGGDSVPGRFAAPNTAVVTQESCGTVATTCPFAMSQRVKSSLAEASKRASALKTQSVSKSLTGCCCKSWPLFTSHFRRMPGSSTDQIEPSGANVNAIKSPAV